MFEIIGKIYQLCTKISNLPFLLINPISSVAYLHGIPKMFSPFATLGERVMTKVWKNILENLQVRYGSQLKLV